jgi:hypothetical protein
VGREGDPDPGGQGEKMVFVEGVVNNEDED